MARLTLKAVNKEIQKKYPKVILVRDNSGYFYITSDDAETYKKLIAPLFETAIETYRLNMLTLDMWMFEVNRLFSKLK